MLLLQHRLPKKLLAASISGSAACASWAAASIGALLREKLLLLSLLRSAGLPAICLLAALAPDAYLSLALRLWSLRRRLAALIERREQHAY